MRSWLEKFNSLSRGMLFTGGYLAPSAVEEIARNSQMRDVAGGGTVGATISARRTAAPRLARTLVCGALQITLR